jgi:hypothetical protein
MLVILLFVNTVLYILDQLQRRLGLPPLPLEPYDIGEASLLKIYLQHKFPMGNLVIKFSIE